MPLRFQIVQKKFPAMEQAKSNPAPLRFVNPEMTLYPIVFAYPSI